MYHQVVEKLFQNSTVILPPTFPAFSREKKVVQNGCSSGLVKVVCIIPVTADELLDTSFGVGTRGIFSTSTWPYLVVFYVYLTFSTSTSLFLPLPIFLAVSCSLVQLLVLTNTEHRQIVVTRGECKTSNTRKSIRCETTFHISPQKSKLQDPVDLSPYKIMHLQYHNDMI